MIDKHLSDSVIQQYALDPLACGKEIAGHIDSCAACKEKVIAYQSLFSAIADQPKPAFDFDLSELVLSKIAQPRPAFSLLDFIIYFLVFVGIGSIAFAGYFFRKYFIKIFTGILPFIVYMVLIITLTILIFQAIDFYKSYQKKIRALNL